MHQGDGLVKFAVAHQISVSDRRFPVSKRGNVYTVVSEGSQDQEWQGSKGIASKNVHQIAPSKVLLKHSISPGGDPDPPSNSTLVQVLWTQSQQKVTTGPRVVLGVQVRAKISVPVPSLGVDNKVQLDQ